MAWAVAYFTQKVFLGPTVENELAGPRFFVWHESWRSARPQQEVTLGMELIYRKT